MVRPRVPTGTGGKVPAARARAPKVASSLERTFETLWRMHGRARLPGRPGEQGWTVITFPEREYVFHETRKWRLDFAWPEQKVAVELEGGIWSRGRHVRPKGFQGDLDKHNALIAAGWRPFRFTADDLRKKPMQCCELVAAALAGARP